MKRLTAILLVSLFFMVSLRSAQAAMLTFTKNGEVYWNVLGLEDSTLEVTKVVEKFVSGMPSTVILSNDQGTVRLSYGDRGEREVDISGYNEDIVEIEGKESAKKLFIRATDNGFSIREKAITANTSFPIKINSPQNKIAVTTPSGERFLSVSPFDAVNQIVRTNIISAFAGEATIDLVEKSEGEIAYVIIGKKDIQLFNIFMIEVPITAEVSALSGNVIDVVSPLWYSVVDFLLV